MTYLCVYCTEKLSTFSLIVQHLMEQHHDKEPELCREQGRTITINKESEKIHVSKPNVVPKESPLKKIVKVTDTTNREIDASTSSDCENESFEITRIDTNESSYQDIVSLLPEFIQTLKENGRETEYVSLNRLLAEKKIPMVDIAFLLFLDVVRWFSLDGYTTSMRYSEEVKLFWRTGLRLLVVDF